MRKITLVGEVPTQPLRLATGDMPVTWNTVPVAPLQGATRAKVCKGRETLVLRECDCWLNCGPCTCTTGMGASLAQVRDERRVL